MNVPIETVLAMLAIEMFRALAGPEGLRPPGVWTILAATGGWIAFQYALAALLARRTRRRLRRAGGTTLDILEDFRFRLMVLRAALVVLAFAHTYLTRWPTFVEETLRLPEWSVVDDVAAVAPFVAAMAAGWLATYRADQILSRRPWGLGEYVWFQARYSLLLVLLPWLVLRALEDSRALWPEDLREAAESAVARAAVFALTVALAAVLVPAFFKWLFRAVSMPDSPVRTRLEALAARAAVAFRDILVWRMARARILNAAVVGVFPRFRYVLFSDALLETLSPEECEAVLGHELGHTRHRHVHVYMAFALGFVALAYVAVSLLPREIGSDYLVGMPVLAALAAVYFRYVFGHLSRTFERQADAYAAEVMGSPVPLILALEKIALMSGDVRELGSWRHGSVAERVRYLCRAGYDEAERRRNDARARAASWAVLFLVAAMGATAVTLSLREPAGLAAEIPVREDRVAERPEDDHLWVRLAELHADCGNARRAEEAFGKALENNSRHGRASAGLLRLRLASAERPDEALVDEALAVGGSLASSKAKTDDASRWAGRLLLAEVHLKKALPELYDPRGASRNALEAYREERAAGGRPRPGTYETLARAHLEAGDVESALRFASEGARRYPHCEALRSLLREVKEAGEAGASSDRQR